VPVVGGVHAVLVEAGRFARPFFFVRGCGTGGEIGWRARESSFNVADCDALLIGGLTQDKSTRVNSGLSFLPPCMAGYTASTGKAEIALLLQVQAI
jgi:hypothetical protein